MIIATEETVVELTNVVNKQIENLLVQDGKVTEDAVERALKRCEKSFSMTTNKYYFIKGQKVQFNRLHLDSYGIFLYYLSNTLSMEHGLKDTADQVFGINRIFCNTNWYHEVMLPDYFHGEHPSASVMGRANYGNYFMFRQGCTVGGNRKDGQLFYPTIGHHVDMNTNSAIIGNSHIGNYVVISAGTLIINKDIPDYSLVFGNGKNLTVLTKNKEYMEKYFTYWKDMQDNS